MLYLGYRSGGLCVVSAKSVAVTLLCTCSFV